MVSPLFAMRYNLGCSLIFIDISENNSYSQPGKISVRQYWGVLHQYYSEHEHR